MIARAIAMGLALLLLAAGSAEAAKRKVPRGFYGVNYAGGIEEAPGPAQAAQWDKLAEAGVESSRVLFNWDVAEHDQGKIDWQRTDTAVGSAASRGIEMLAVVMYAPRWAKRYPDQNSSPPKRIADYTDFVRAAIARYGPSGTFWTENPYLPKRPVRRWQIWNEPDLKFQWYRPGPPENPMKPKDIAAYGALLRASYRAVHKADPGAKVLLAALSFDSWLKLPRLYRYGGVRGYFDIAGVQAYAGVPSFVPTVLERFRAVLDDHGARGVPIWATEMAWPASKGKSDVPEYATGYMSNFITTDNGQAARLRVAYRTLAGAKLRNRLKLQRVYWFTGVSLYRSYDHWEYAGLLDFDGSSSVAKPSYDAYRESAQRDEGCAKTAAGACR